MSQPVSGTRALIAKCVFGRNQAVARYTSDVWDGLLAENLGPSLQELSKCEAVETNSLLWGGTLLFIAVASSAFYVQDRVLRVFRR